MGRDALPVSSGGAFSTPRTTTTACLGFLARLASDWTTRPRLHYIGHLGKDAARRDLAALREGRRYGDTLGELDRHVSRDCFGREAQFKCISSHAGPLLVTHP